MLAPRAQAEAGLGIRRPDAQLRVSGEPVAGWGRARAGPQVAEDFAGQAETLRRRAVAAARSLRLNTWFSPDLTAGHNHVMYAILSVHSCGRNRARCNKTRQSMCWFWRVSRVVTGIALHTASLTAGTASKTFTNERTIWREKCRFVGEVDMIRGWARFETWVADVTCAYALAARLNSFSTLYSCIDQVAGHWKQFCVAHRWLVRDAVYGVRLAVAPHDLPISSCADVPFRMQAARTTSPQFI